MLDKGYVEEDVRYTMDGRMIRFKFAPARMNMQALAKRILSRACEKPEVFKDYFMQGVGGIIRDTLNRDNLLQTKPNKEEIKAFQKQVQEASHLVRTNLKKILKDLLFYSGDNPDLEYLTKDQKENLEAHDSRSHDAAVFNLRLAKSITGLVNSDGFNAVLSDYRTVQEVLKDPRRFNELEKLCQSQLRRFVTDKRIRYMDEESQRQEGLLAIWACASKYEARDFARFSSLAKVALNNKYKNLLRFFTADKRRVQKYTSPAGSATDPKESFLARQIDNLTTANWRRVQRIQLSEGAQEDAEYDPFFELPVLGDYSGCTSPEKEWVCVLDKDGIESVEELDGNNFPHLNEGKVEYMRPGHLYDRKKKKAQWEYIEKWHSGQVYVDEKGILRVKDPSPLLQEMDRSEDLDAEFKRRDGSYKDLPEERRRKNLGLLNRIVKNSGDMTFEVMTYNLDKLSWPFSVSKGAYNEWAKAKSELITAVNREYPGAIEDGIEVKLKRDDLNFRMVSESIKRLYVQCQILSQSERGIELYLDPNNLDGLENFDELPF